ncbi:Wd repeat-containing protein [Thalictrum thalictroides]|uniref:Wd repeat-containing protein n=1 Tax=Thalictrum thalictroides TaxID=46969 RepID=A0A7J6VS71_THATH|nr:Wd repeat-containing protein [Thalictrum thalictroides]
MVKSYLRYEPAATFGVIVSIDSNITYDSTGKHLLAPALEKVGIWNVKQGICTKTLSPSTSSRGSSIAVTSIASSPSSLVASGYADGSIRIWDCEKGTCETTLNGHKGAVSALRYSKLGALLASGSNDNDVILWDVVGEAGLFRLRGHRDQVTDVVFLDSGKKLVSSSKDKFLRLWDLDTQHCVQIISGHHSEIWSIDVDPEERYLVTGSADPELRFYTIKHDSLDVEPVLNLQGTEAVSNGDSTTQNKWQVLTHFGEIQRKSKDRVGSLRFDKSGNLLACQMAGKMVEIFQVLDEADSKRKAKRRVHRKKEKKIAKGALSENGETDVVPKEEENILTVTVSDVFKLHQTLRASNKICSISFCPITQKSSLATFALSLNNNLLEVYSVEPTAITKAHTIERLGHRSVIRSVTLSSDNTLLMSTCHNAVKIWNPSLGSCLRTIDSGFGRCCSFIPGNKFALVGTNAGTLEIIDVGSGTCVEVVEAHGDSVGSIVMLPNEKGFVTGSADHNVKFWEYRQKPGQESKQQSVTNTRSLKMNDEVHVVAVSPDAKYILVALLDCTIKVFFMDTLKCFISLYGHKSPVLCMDISSDGDLVVSGSADKNLKIWGLDFGDCHKSIFAHSGSVMAVQFVHNTHYMFSVGKDSIIKYWDADKFELLLTLNGHHAAIGCLAVSNRGDFIVTGSHDRSIRRWDRTEEPFFIEEEKEKRLEEKFEDDLDISLDSRYALTEEIPEEGVVGLAGKKTKETLTATDLILDALDAAEVELNRMAEHKEEKKHGVQFEFQPNVILLGLSPSDYVLRALSNTQTNDLEATLLALPFSDALKLMSYLKDWSSIPDKVELVCRVATVLLQIHHNQLVTTPAARPVLTILKDILFARVKECKDTLGFNLAAMDHLKQLMSSKSDAPFRDAKTKLLEIKKRSESRNSTRSDAAEGSQEESGKKVESCFFFSSKP